MSNGSTTISAGHAFACAKMAPEKAKNARRSLPLRLLRSSVSRACLALALFASATAVQAADYHYASSSNVFWNQTPSGGFDGDYIPGASDRAIYDRAGTGQSILMGAAGRRVGQLVFLAPYTGTGFMKPTISPTTDFTIYGLEGLGVDSEVNQQITLHDRLVIGGDQEWRINSATGSITQIVSASPSRFVNLDDYWLTLNAVQKGNHFDLATTISGTGGLIIKGAGTTYLTATNTYSGGTVLEGGTLSVSSDANLGAATGELTFNGGVLQVTGTAFNSTARTINWGAGGGGFDIVDAGNTFTVNQALATGGQLTKLGNGVLELTAANTYTGATIISAGTLALTGAGSIAESSDVRADGTLDISATTAGASIKSLSGNGVVDLGAKTLTLTSAAGTFAGGIQGTGGLTLTGGTETLTGANTYTGATTISGGTLVAGGLGTLSSASDYTVGANGTLDLAGFSHTLASLTNGGGVRLSNAANTTLTTTGDYVGTGGTLYLSSVLGTDNSPTDLLHVQGDTSGTTGIRVINVGGVGGLTTGDGIKIIEVDGNSDAGAFALAGPAIGGAYRYDLFQNGFTDPTDGDWYLRSTGLAPTLPVYENYPQVLLGMVELPTLQQRVGTRYWTALDGAAPAGGATPSAIWARIEGAHGRVKSTSSRSGDARFDNDTSLMQVGLDGQLAANASGMWVGGLTAQYGRASADIYSGLGDGSNSTTSYGIGATLTWYGENGFYVDGQAQLATLRSNLSAANIGSIGDRIHGTGHALSLEAGRKIGVGGGWSLTPQAQLAYATVDFDRFTDRFGAEVSLRKGDSLKGRLGVAADYEPGAGTHVYGIGNLTYEFLDGTAVAVSGIDLAIKPQRFGAELGLGGTYGWAGGKYALHGEALAATSFQGSRSLKGTVGFTMGF
jgi:outer membrane autotransporter protein